jgi:hypothetical protein
MSILPVGTFPVFKRKMAEFWGRPDVKSFFRKHGKETRQIFKVLEKGPISPRELAHMGKMTWGWGRKTHIGNVVLTRLWVSGRVMIHHRDGNMKYYALAEDIIPRRILETPAPAKGKDAYQIALMICRSSRLGSPSGAPEQWHDVGKTPEVRAILLKLEKDGLLFSLTLEGSEETLYAPVDDLTIWKNPTSPVEDYIRFLAPLDPLLWSRKVFRLVYGHDYCWEVYKIPKDRLYGYYCLPVLFNGDLAGLLEPFYRKKDRVLEIRSFHLLNNSLDKRKFRRALDEEMARFRAYLGAEDVKSPKSGPGREWFR